MSTALFWLMVVAIIAMLAFALIGLDGGEWPKVGTGPSRVIF